MSEASSASSRSTRSWRFPFRNSSMLSRRCLTSFARTAMAPSSSRAWPASMSALWMAARATRRADLRRSSPARRASRRSASSRCLMLTVLVNKSGSQPGTGLVAALDGLAALGRFLLLTPDAGLLVVLAAAGLGQDPVLLHSLAEALQRRVEALVVTNDNFGH